MLPKDIFHELILPLHTMNYYRLPNEEVADRPNTTKDKSRNNYKNILTKENEKHTWSGKDKVSGFWASNASIDFKCRK